MTKKTISFRIDEEVLQKLDNLEGNRTDNIINAIQNYIDNLDKDNTDNTGNTRNTDNRKLIESLEERIAELKHDKAFLEEKVSNTEKALAFEQQAHHEAVQKQLPEAGKGWRRLVFWK